MGTDSLDQMFNLTRMVYIQIGNNMKWDFNYFIISIFTDCEFENFVDSVILIKKEELESNKASLLNVNFSVEDYFNPSPGGNHFPKFSAWENHCYPHKVFFVSNYEDGLYTLCNVIHRNIGCNLVMCTLSNESTMEYPFSRFFYSNDKCVERAVMAYKEDGWIFYESGTPLEVENTNYYKNKLKKNRLNSTIIEEYLQKMGINLWDVDDYMDNSITYVQNAW